MLNLKPGMMDPIELLPVAFKIAVIVNAVINSGKAFYQIKKYLDKGKKK